MIYSKSGCREESGEGVGRRLIGRELAWVYSSSAGLEKV